MLLFVQAYASNRARCFDLFFSFRGYGHGENDLDLDGDISLTMRRARIASTARQKLPSTTAIRDLATLRFKPSARDDTIELSPEFRETIPIFIRCESHASMNLDMWSVQDWQMLTYGSVILSGRANGLREVLMGECCMRSLLLWLLKYKRRSMNNICSIPWATSMS